jgi:hypothetical protein
MLAYHHAARLLRDPAAEARARRAFEALLRGALAERPAARRRAGNPQRSRKTGAAAS